MPTAFAGAVDFQDLAESPALLRAGFRFGERGTMSSRNLMFGELADLFNALPPDAARDEYARAVVDDNALGKPTHSARRSTRQRLTELYGLDRRLAVFRVLRRLWEDDPPGRPLLAMLCALARDPLLRSTAPTVLGRADGESLDRHALAKAVREATGPRFNDAVLAKVTGNAASSWRLAGHLVQRSGRDRRDIRRRVHPTPGAAAFALWLAGMEGLAGLSLLDSRWAAALDVRGEAMLQWAVEAGRVGLIRVRAAGEVVEIDTEKLDDAQRKGPTP